MQKLLDVVRGLAEYELSGSSDVMVMKVTGDSRKVQPHDVFVAVRGTVINGHDKIADAVENGATVVVGELNLGDLNGRISELGHSITYIRVPDTRSAHAALLRASVPEISDALASMMFLGVTGTNGKTTVATLLTSMLMASGTETGFIGTTGIRYQDVENEATHTTPDVERLYELIVMMYRAGVGAIVMEVSSHALDQNRIDGIPFAGAVFTNLTRDHLDYHHTMEAYAAAKQQLFTNLSETAIAVLNADDSWAPYMRRNCNATTLEVGTGSDSEVQIVNVETSATGSAFTLQINPSVVNLHPSTMRIAASEVHRNPLEGEPLTFTIHTPLIGEFNVVNAALCVSLLWARGLAVPALQEIMQVVTGPRGRMECMLLPKRVTVVIDYAHTPDALLKALTTLRAVMQAPDARLHVVFGCGGDRDAGKRPEMGRIAAANADRVYITTDNPRTEDAHSIINQILEGIPERIRDSDAVHIVEDRRHAIIAAIMKAHRNDVVLIAGKGHEEYQLVGQEKLPFSDREVVNEFLREQAE